MGTLTSTKSDEPSMLNKHDDITRFPKEVKSTSNVYGLPTLLHISRPSPSAD